MSPNFESDELSIPFGYCYSCCEKLPVEIFDLGSFEELDLEIVLEGQTVLSNDLQKMQLVFCGKCGSLLNKSGNVSLEYFGESELRALGWKIVPAGQQTDTEQGTTGT